MPQNELLSVSINIQTNEDCLSSSFDSRVVETIEKEFGYRCWSQVKTIVAVSGGPDSVALLRGMLSLAQLHGDRQPKNLIVAHVDHGLRGPESDGDAEFVRALSNQFGLEFVLANSVAIKSKDNPFGGGPSEESLRNFRYDNLLATATQLGARYVVTGHNLNDQIETILFRIFRATGIAGLSGIPPVRLGNDSVSIIRPLLNVRRWEIESYLEEIEQDYRVDSSNASSVYQRNFLRNELIPLIESRFGASVEQSLLRLAGQAREANEFIAEHAERLGNAITSETPNSIELDCSKLDSQPPIVVRQFLVQIWTRKKWPRQAMGFDWWEKICVGITAPQTGDQESLVLNMPGGIRFSRTENLATITS